jgi:hypothetical protein
LEKPLIAEVPLVVSTKPRRFQPKPASSATAKVFSGTR